MQKSSVALYVTKELFKKLISNALHVYENFGYAIASRHATYTWSVASPDRWFPYSQNESFWLLSIPEKPKPSGTMIGSVSATRSYFSQTDFFPYFSNWSGAYERHYQRGITRHNELRNEETKKVNRIFLNHSLCHIQIHIHVQRMIPADRNRRKLIS